MERALNISNIYEVDFGSSALTSGNLGIRVTERSVHGNQKCKSWPHRWGGNLGWKRRIPC